MPSRFDRHLWLAKSVAHRMRRIEFALAYEDIRQAALMGLWLADQKAAPTMPDKSFVYFARVRIRGEIIDELRRTVPGARRLRGEAHDNPHKLDPALAAMARDAGLLPQVAFDRSGNADEETEFIIVDAKPTPDQEALELEGWQAVESAIAELPDRLRGLLLKRLAGEHPIDIAKEMGVSQARVSQLTAAAVRVIAEKIRG